MEAEEEPEEEQEEKEDTSSSKEEEEEDHDEPDSWKPSGKISKNPIWKKVQQILEKGKSHAETATFNTLLPESRRRLRKTTWSV